MPDALPVAEADAIAFVQALKPPVSPDLADRPFFGLASFANGGARTTTVELADLGAALGEVQGDCTWEVGPGDVAVAQRPPLMDTPKYRARAMDRVIAGYLAGVEVTVVCDVQKPTYVCPEPQEELPPDEQGMDCAVVVEELQQPIVTVAVGQVDGALRIRGWQDLRGDSWR